MILDIAALAVSTTRMGRVHRMAQAMQMGNARARIRRGAVARMKAVGASVARMGIVGMKAKVRARSRMAEGDSKSRMARAVMEEMAKSATGKAKAFGNIAARATGNVLTVCASPSQNFMMVHANRMELVNASLTVVARANLLGRASRMGRGRASRRTQGAWKRMAPNDVRITRVRRGVR